MPGLDGLEATRRILAADDTARVQQVRRARQADQPRQQRAGAHVGAGQPDPHEKEGGFERVWDFERRHALTETAAHFGLHADQLFDLREPLHPGLAVFDERLVAVGRGEELLDLGLGQELAEGRLAGHVAAEQRQEAALLRPRRQAIRAFAGLIARSFAFHDNAVWLRPAN